MPSLLPLFHEIYPSVSINLIEQGDELLMQSLRSNDADLVVGGMTPGSQETSVNLALEQLLLIVPRSFNPKAETVPAAPEGRPCAEAR